MKQEPIKEVGDMLSFLFKLMFIYPIYFVIWMIKIPVYIFVKAL